MSATVDELRAISGADHSRGCEGRQYACSCGYDHRVETALTEAADTIARLEEENGRQSAENTRLRAALAQSDQPCAYCSLPADEWNKCQHGFPGCDRADDAMGCPHLGSSMHVSELEARLEALRVALAQIEGVAKDKSEKAWFRLDTIADVAHYGARGVAS